MLICIFVSPVGFLESLDDFYILSSGLILLQTTNSVYNKTLLKLVVPQSLLAWQRVRVANMMANDGRQWAEIFSNFNSGKWPAEELLGRYVGLDFELTSRAVPIPYFVSPNIPGTYNNQYMVLDLKKVKPKHSLDTGTLYVVEQIPTYIEYSDQTEILRKGTVFTPEVWKSDESVGVHAYVVGSVWDGTVRWGGCMVGKKGWGSHC